MVMVFKFYVKNYISKVWLLTIYVRSYVYQTGKIQNTFKYNELTTLWTLTILEIANAWNIYLYQIDDSLATENLIFLRDLI